MTPQEIREVARALDEQEARRRPSKWGPWFIGAFIVVFWGGVALSIVGM